MEKNANIDCSNEKKNSDAPNESTTELSYFFSPSFLDPAERSHKGKGGTQKKNHKVVSIINNKLFFFLFLCCV
jgi:hypothetical protein